VDPQPPAQPPVCYRHPDRPTRLACSECGRYICPECSRDAVVGQKCPECTAPGQLTRVIPARTLRHADRRATPVTWALIAVNVAVFIAGEISPSFGNEIIRRAAQHPVLVDAGEWWRLFTTMFLHASILHILFNMYALWLFGPVLERRFGSASFSALYLAAGIAGGTLYQLVGPEAWAVGASGAIFGLFGALLAASYRQRHTRAGALVFRQLAILLAINLLLAFLPGSNIAWQAHIGGLTAGALIGAIWDRLPLTRTGAWKRVTVAVAVAAASLAIVLVG
jgi:membrane associated rhomboid family serine protease